MFCSLQADLARKESALRELEARLEEKDVEALEAKERISGLESRVADLTKRLKGILDSQMRVLVLYDTSVQHLTPPSAERQSIAPGAAGGGLAPEKEKVLVEAVNRLREIEKESHRQIRSMTLEREALKKCVQELTAQVRRAGKKKKKKEKSAVAQVKCRRQSSVVVVSPHAGAGGGSSAATGIATKGPASSGPQVTHGEAAHHQQAARGRYQRGRCTLLQFGHLRVL
jgi:hypothetical protein